METLTFYFDRCFGTRLPRALNHTKPPFIVEWHESKSNRFKQTMPDDQWLAICGQKNWIALSHDRKFHSIAVEATAILQHSVVAFALPGSSERTYQKLEHFVRAYPKMVRIAQSEKPPYLYRVDGNSRFQRVELG